MRFTLSMQVSPPGRESKVTSERKIKSLKMFFTTPHRSERGGKKRGSFFIPSPLSLSKGRKDRYDCLVGKVEKVAGCSKVADQGLSISGRSIDKLSYLLPPPTLVLNYSLVPS